MGKKRQIYVSRAVDAVTGEVLSEQSRTVEQVRSERFVLLILDRVKWGEVFSGCEMRYVWFLFFLVCHGLVSFSDQLIRLSKYDRDMIRGLGCEISDYTIWRAVRSLTEKGVLSKVSKQCYKINPNYFNNGKATKWTTVDIHGGGGQGGDGAADAGGSAG